MSALAVALPAPLIFSGIHTTELVIVLVIILVLFGPKQLPKIGRALGGGIKEFKDGMKTGLDEEEDEDEGRTTVEALPTEESTTAASRETESTENQSESSSS